MKFSEQWLRQWVSPALTAEELVAQITMAGLEVDALEPVAAAFSGVVVAEIVAIEQHPDADKLRVCQVAGGDADTVQVVCGAANARLGLKIPFAKVGAVLPGDFRIKKAKLRGVESFGMLCGASELGMEDKIDGLLELAADAPIGTDIRAYLSLDDNCIDVDLTPNRGDCLSLLGMAREVGVLNKLDVKVPEIAAVAATSERVIAVKVTAAEDCPRYVGRVIEAIDIQAPTPLWMLERLRRSGIRSIDAVVDVTNYVLLELGQPMHAFDLDQLQGGIDVRLSHEGEKLQLLDEQELTLKAGSLVIADDVQALALAGIMGGKATAVSEATQNILLEAAFFTPIKLAGRARGYGLHTDSSHRFERGVDATQQRRAIERATALLLEIVGGKAGPIIEVANRDDKLASVTLSAKRLAQVLGLTIAASDVTDILQRLGLVVNYTNEQWQCEIPAYRFDITIEADLIEEVARIYGYNNLPTRSLTVAVDFVRRTESTTPLQKIKQHLIARDYQEAICYSFIEPKLQASFSDEVPVAVANPISADMAVMRTSLIPGLISVMEHNVKRQIDRVRLFESGLQFHHRGQEFEQQPFLAGLICGPRRAESWHGDTAAVDFFDAKGDVESLLQLCGHVMADIRFVPSSHKGLHPGQCADVYSGVKRLGVLAALHPEFAKTLTISGSVYVFELSLGLLCEGKVPKFKGLSKFPQVRRDIALLLDKTVTAAQITAVIHQAVAQQDNAVIDKAFLHCSVFDVYTGDRIDATKKSLALALYFQHAERSLNDEEVQQTVSYIVAALEAQLAAVLRN